MSQNMHCKQTKIMTYLHYLHLHRIDTIDVDVFVAYFRTCAEKYGPLIKNDLSLLYWYIYWGSVFINCTWFEEQKGIANVYNK